jgi:YgiT-type zinc finger domain-containing protein
VTSDKHFDGGRLRSSTVNHRHVVEHPDGRVSAVVVRGVPGLVCELCEEHYYEPEVTDAIVAIVQATEVSSGEAVAVGYSPAHAA